MMRMPLPGSSWTPRTAAVALAHDTTRSGFRNVSLSFLSRVNLTQNLPLAMHGRVYIADFAEHPV